MGQESLLTVLRRTRTDLGAGESWYNHDPNTDLRNCSCHTQKKTLIPCVPEMNVVNK